MAEVKEHYDNLANRQIKIAQNESKGLRMLHDDFDDPNWKHGDPIIGTMTFTDEQPITIEPEPSRDLAAEIDDLKARIGKLEGGKLNV